MILLMRSKDWQVFGGPFKEWLAKTQIPAGTRIHLAIGKGGIVMQDIIVVDEGGISDADMTKLQDAGYMVIKKDPGSSFEVYRPSATAIGGNNAAKNLD